VRKANSDPRSLAAWAGVVGPVLFVGIFTLEGLLRPGYKPLRMYVSALSLGPRGWIQMSNFIVFGMLLLIFTRGIAANVTPKTGSRGGLTVLRLIALLFVASGFFVMDPDGTPQNPATIHGTIHGLAGAIAFVLMPTSCFVVWRDIRVDPSWRSLSSWSLAFGVIEVVTVLTFTVASKVPAARNASSDWLGLIQRTALVPFMFWLFLIALALLRRRHDTS
jgi:hypothetical membrane protein